MADGRGAGRSATSPPAGSVSAMTSSEIKAKAKALGFDACGIAPATNHPELSFYREWLDRGYAGAMAYLHRSADRRADVPPVRPPGRPALAAPTVFNNHSPESTG